MRRRTKIFAYELPSNPADRILELRGVAGELPYYDRYIEGEFLNVWNELREMGDDVNYDPVAIDGWAVALETMRRADLNVRLIVKRLVDMYYRFVPDIFAQYWRTSALDTSVGKALEGRLDELAGELDPECPANKILPELAEYWERVQTAREERSRAARDRRFGIVRAHAPPEPTADLQMRRLVRIAGEIPLSLRAFYTLLGGVNLVGMHPAVTGDCDPLFVAPLQFALDSCLAREESRQIDQPEVPFEIPISPSQNVKAAGSGPGPLYSVTVPNGGADATVNNHPKSLYFVEYLRLAFRSGGFPGSTSDPEISDSFTRVLSEGMLEL